MKTSTCRRTDRKQDGLERIVIRSIEFGQSLLTVRHLDAILSDKLLHQSPVRTSRKVLKNDPTGMNCAQCLVVNHLF